MSGLIRIGELEAAGDDTTAAVIRRPGSAAQAAVDSRVGDVAAEIIANDSTVIAAAADAVTAEIAGRDLVEGIAFTDPEYAIPFTDESGMVAGGVLTDGSTQFQRMRFAPSSIPLPALGPTVGLFEHADPEYAIPFTDGTGFVAGGLRHDGSWNFPQMDSASPTKMASSIELLSKSRRDRIGCVGDSLTRGYSANALWNLADAYPAKLAAELPATTTVFNLGESGQTIDEISIRVGALPLVAQAGFTIPATTTPVPITVQAGIGWRPERNWEFPGSFDGIPGIVTRTGTATTALTFTRTTPGDAHPVAAGVEFAAAQMLHQDDTLILFAGRNDVGYGVTGTEATILEHVLVGYDRLIKWMAPQVKRFIAVGTINATTELSGSGTHALVTAINAGVQQMVGAHYFDLRRYLIDQAIYDLGITPTSTDLARMAADTLPPSILDDDLHYSRATAAMVAKQLAPILLTRGWYN